MTIKKKLERLEIEKQKLLEDISKTVKMEFSDRPYIQPHFFVVINGKPVIFSIDALRVGLSVNIGGLEKDDSFIAI